MRAMAEMTEYFRETDMEFSRSIVTERAQITLAGQYSIVDRYNLIGLCIPRQRPSHLLNARRAHVIQNFGPPNDIRNRARKSRNEAGSVVKLDANSRVLIDQLGR